MPLFIVALYTQWAPTSRLNRVGSDFENGLGGRVTAPQPSISDLEFLILNSWSWISRLAGAITP